MTEIQTITEKSTSEQLSEILQQLSSDQLRFIVAMQEFPTKKEAAESIGIQPNTVYGWPQEVNEAARLMTLDIAESARVMRKRALIKAMAVKLAGLDSGDEKVRQNAATEIIEAELGKASQHVDMSADGIVKFIVEYADGISDNTTETT